MGKEATAPRRRKGRTVKLDDLVPKARIMGGSGGRRVVFGERLDEEAVPDPDPSGQPTRSSSNKNSPPRK
jgi:hypothetical protein